MNLKRAEELRKALRYINGDHIVIDWLLEALDAIDEHGIDLKVRDLNLQGCENMIAKQASEIADLKEQLGL